MIKKIIVSFPFLFVGQVFAETELYNQFSMDAYSESFPVNDLIKGLDNDYSKGNSAYVFAREMLGVKKNNYYFALVSRFDTTLEYSKNTAELIYSNETDRPVPKNRHFDIDLRINQSASHGFVFGHIFNSDSGLIEGLMIDIGLQVLESKKMTNGSINGAIDSFDTEYQGNLHIDYFYTEDTLFDRSVDAKTGYGVSLDFSTLLEINAQHMLSVRLLDIINGLYWQDMNYTIANINTNRIQFDANGKLDTHPALQGVERNKNYIQHLTPSFSLNWSYTISPEQQIDTEFYQVFAVKELRWRYIPTYLAGWYFYASSNNALGIGLNKKFFSFFIASDDGNINQANSLNLNVRVNVFF